MGIPKLMIRGFRSLRDVEWRSGNLNVVIGPNASGKKVLNRDCQRNRGLSAPGGFDFTASRHPELARVAGSNGGVPAANAVKSNRFQGFRDPL